MFKPLVLVLAKLQIISASKFKSLITTQQHNILPFVPSMPRKPQSTTIRSRYLLKHLCNISERLTPLLACLLHRQNLLHCAALPHKMNLLNTCPSLGWSVRFRHSNAHVDHHPNIQHTSIPPLNCPYLLQRDVSAATIALWYHRSEPRLRNIHS